MKPFDDACHPISLKANNPFNPYSFLRAGRRKLPRAGPYLHIAAKTPSPTTISHMNTLKPRTSSTSLPASRTYPKPQHLNTSTPQHINPLTIPTLPQKHHSHYHLAHEHTKTLHINITSLPASRTYPKPQHPNTSTPQHINP